jgi:hypothetical protein
MDERFQECRDGDLTDEEADAAGVTRPLSQERIPGRTFVGNLVSSLFDSAQRQRPRDKGQETKAGRQGDNSRVLGQV